MIGCNAIIGYTGFVGSNLILQHDFDEFYNSQNIDDIKGESFDLIVCAGAPGTKWMANKDHVADLRNIGNLISMLETINASVFILISTIDVFREPIYVDEGSPISIVGNDAYGANRAYLEDAVKSVFDNVLIVRLPTIYSTKTYGNGLIYDIKNKDYKYIPQSGEVQVYNLSHLWDDIKIALDAELHVINIATEPIRIKELCKHGLSDKKPVYDMRTRHASLWGREGHYLYTKEEIIEELKEFI